MGLLVTYAVFDISSVKDDIRGTAARIDQVFPTLVEQSAAIAGIKGSLEGSAKEIAAVAGNLSAISGRLEETVQAQETQTKNIAAMTASVDKLTESVAANQAQLDKISTDIVELRKSGMLSPGGMYVDFFAIAPTNISDATQATLKSAGIKIISTPEWAEAVKLAGETQSDDVWLGTNDIQFIDAVAKMKQQ